MALVKKVAIFYWEWGRNSAPREAEIRPLEMDRKGPGAKCVALKGDYNIEK